MVSLFWLRVTTVLLVNFSACLTTWSISGRCTSFYMHQSWQVCSIMFYWWSHISVQYMQMAIHEIAPISASQETVGKVSKESKGAQECLRPAVLMGHTQVNGTWQTASEAAGRACQHHCRGTLQHLWQVVESGGSPSWLEKGKYYTHLQKQKKKKKIFGNLQMSQPHLSTLKNYGVGSPRSYFWAQRRRRQLGEANTYLS